jgi:hypothetical protein
MSFLNQLKSQAHALQSEQLAQKTHNDVNVRLTESALKTVWFYASDLVKQLDVIQPQGPTVSLDGKTQWPATKLVNFRVDSRKKLLRDTEVVDYIALAWRIVPATGGLVAGSISANFPPELSRIETRLSAGTVKHERVSVLHPVKNTLQAIRFDYEVEARAGVTITPDHDAATLMFRLANLQGLEVVYKSIPVHQIQTLWLDELAKLICGQTNQFA